MRVRSILLLLIAVSTYSGSVLAQDCAWKYKCEWVLQQEPFICGQWAPEAEKICPTEEELATTTTVPDAVEDVGSFTPFHMIKAPCNAPYVSDRHGKCRLVFG